MKLREILLVLLALTVIGQASAQEDDYRKFKFGFKIDPNVSWMSPKTNEMTSEGALGRFSFGLNADVMFSDKYAFGTGVSIMGNGGVLRYLDTEFRDNDPTEYIVRRERKYRLKYVEVPLTFKLRTEEIGYMTYWGQFGLGLGFMTRATGDESLSFLGQRDADAANWVFPGDEAWKPKEDVEDEDLDISDDLVPVRASLIVGAGVDYSLSGTTALMFGLTYNNGFTNVLKGNGIQQDDDGAPVFESGEVKNFELKSISNHLMLTAGILF